MTQHEEEVQMLVRKFGRTLHYTEYSFTPAQFTALIAEVRRQAMEEAIAACDRTASQFYENNLSMYGDGAQTAGDAIRAKLEEEK